MLTNVYIAGDHAIKEFKEVIIKFVKELGFSPIYIGPTSFESTDYPIFGLKVAQELIKNPKSLAIVMCGTGIGITNSCNRIKGIRACVANVPMLAKAIRSDFDCNVLGLGARVIGIEILKECISNFLLTAPSKNSAKKSLLEDFEKSTNPNPENVKL